MNDRLCQEDIDCYRVNYDPAGWKKIAAERGPGCVIIGSVDAIRVLCNEVEALWAGKDGISRCLACECMTKTVGKCGKCGQEKA